MITENVAQQWYFAYGANMTPSVFIARRKIQPLQTEIASLPSHCLCFNVWGVPYSEPALAGLLEKSSQEVTVQSRVFGVAYLLKQEDLRRVVASEG